MKTDIMTHYPYPVPRIGHVETLRVIESMWDTFDVALIVAPTGSGKTSLRRAIAYWAGDANMFVPSNALILQELNEFPDTNKVLRRDEFYRCDYCYDMDLERARLRGQPVLTVPHMTIAHKLRRRVLIVDEGHKLIDTNRDLQTVKAWRRNTTYPLTTYTRQQFEQYLQLNPEAKNRDKLLMKLRTNDYMVKRENASWRSKQLDCMRLIPMTPELHPALARGVDKIILLSATLSREDVTDLGVGRNKRVLTIEVPSPIPGSNRPLIRSYVGGLAFHNLAAMAPMLARRIMEIARFHSGRKGLVHITYGLSRILRPYITDPRFIWHDAGDSKERLRDWMATTDGVFMGSGFNEGLDLAGPEYEWQAIAKIPWQSLADVAIRKRTEECQGWYIWQTLREVVQAYGRICRGPTDEGVTYVLDSTFERLISEGRKYGLIPKFFNEVL